MTCILFTPYSIVTFIDSTNIKGVLATLGSEVSLGHLHLCPSAQFLGPRVSWGLLVAMQSWMLHWQGLGSSGSLVVCLAWDPSRKEEGGEKQHELHKQLFALCSHQQRTMLATCFGWGREIMLQLV